jgi:hypothetical protein
MIILSLTSNAIILSTPLWLSEDHVFGMAGGLEKNFARRVLAWLGVGLRELRCETPRGTPCRQIISGRETVSLDATSVLA